MRRYMELLADPLTVAAARDFVRGVLEQQGIDSFAALLVTSELATNVVRHAATPYKVTVSLLAEAVRVEVEDGEGSTRLAQKLGSGQGGYGLQVLQTVASDWGVEHTEGGKTVWVELPRNGAE